MKKSTARIAASTALCLALASTAVPAMAASGNSDNDAHMAEIMKGYENLEEGMDGVAAPATDTSTSKKATVKPRITIKGKTMVIKLKENTTTGYGWTCKVKGSAVKLDKKHSGYIDPKNKKDLCGAPGTHKYTFKSFKAGKTATIKMVYSRSWDTSDKTVVTVKVKTSKKGKISVTGTTVK